MCDDIKICIRRLCIALFALIGIAIIFAGLGVKNEGNADEKVPYILYGVGGAFICIAVCICKCFPLIVVTPAGEYEYTGF